MTKEILLNVRSQKAYDSLVTQLAKEDYTWVSGYKATQMDKWYIYGRETVVTIWTETKKLVYGTTEDEVKEGKRILVFKPSHKLAEALQS